MPAFVTNHLCTNQASSRCDEAFLRLAENSPDAIMRYDINGRILYLNRKLARDLEVAPAELIGRTTAEVWPDGRFTTIEQAVLRAARAGESSTVELEHEVSGGRWIYSEIRIVAERDDSGKILGVLAFGRDITATRETGQRLRHFIERLPGEVCVLRRSPGGRDNLLCLSPGVGTLFGLNNTDEVREDATPLYDLAHPDDHPRIGATLDESAQALEPFYLEFRIRKPNRAEHWVEMRATPAREADGTVLWYGIMLDITERKRAQWRMELLERTIDQSHEAFFLSDDQLRFVEVNDAACRSLGYTREELLGRPLPDIAPDITPEECLTLMREGSDTPQTLETRLRTRDGRIFPVELGVSVFVHGGVRYGRAMVRDISRRKELLTHLEQSERDFRSLAENLPNNIARWDTEGRYIFVNPSHERLLGISNEALVGKRISEIFPQTPLVVVEAAIRRVAASGEPELLAGETVSEASGKERLHDIKLVPEFGPDGTVVSVLGLGLGRDMTELHLLQEAVSVRKQAFRSLAESSPDHIIRADRNHRIRYFNQKFMHVLGLRCSEEVLGRRHDEIWSGSRYATIAEAAARAIESGEQQTLELINPGKEGKRYHQIVVVPERGVDGAIIGTLAFCRDITTIRETEHRLRHFIYTLPGLAFALRLTPEGQMSFPFTSPNILDLYGLTPEAVQDDAVPLLAHVLPDDRRRIEAAIAESAQTLRALRIEFRVHRPGLPESWVECRALPDLQPDGCTLWHGIMLDISERKQAQWRMELLERAINQSNEGFFLINEQTRFVDVNDAACRSLGYTREELLRLTPPDIGPDFSRETVLELIRSGTKSPITFETCHRTKEGRIFPVELTCVTFIHEDDRYSLAMVREISERKQAEAAERAHLEEASRLQRVQTANELATLLAHEINQPLAAIATYAEASLMQLRNSPLAHDRLSTNLERIGKQAIRAGDSIRYMRNFIRRGHIDPVPMNLITVVQRAYDLQSANARGAGIRLEMKVDAKLPPVSGVDVQVEQVLLNLLRNAQDAIHDAGMEEGSITVRAQQVERMIQVTVLDTGPGIDAARAEKLFDPLASTKAYGLGVGLRISRSLVEAHNGRLWVEPGTPCGCFHFTLPIAEE